MKKIFSVIIFTLLINSSFCQDISTLMRLHELSILLGSASSTPIDTLIIKAEAKNLNHRIVEQLMYLFKAAEFYSTKDFENSSYYIKKIRFNFRNPEYNNLKLFLAIGSYANLKDLKNTAEYFYIINRTESVDPNNMKIIKSEIRKNFKKDAFFDALSHYYYYHKRLEVIREIGFEE